MKNETGKNKKSINDLAVDAVVLAGGDGSVIDPNTPVKGMVQIAEKPMVQWVLEALAKSQIVRDVVVVLPAGPDSGEWEHLATHVVRSDGQISENMVAALDMLPQSDLIVTVTSDIPTVSPEAIDDLIVQTVERGAELSYPFVTQEVMQAAYPGAQRTFIKIRVGKVTGGNAAVFNPKHLQVLHDFAQELFDARKSPMKLASVAGIKFVIKLAMGRLDLDDVEDRIKLLTGVTSAAIFSDYASIGADVDKPADVAVAQAKLTSIE